MPINPNIAMGYQPSAQLESPLNMMSKMAALRDAEQANQMRGMQMQQMQSEAQRQAALRAALRGVDITTPEGLGAARNAYINAGDVKGYHELATGQAALTKAERESAAAQLKLVSDKIDLGVKFLSGAFDQPSYEARKKEMAAAGLDISEMPPQYSEDYKRSELLKGIAAKDQLKLHFTDLGGIIQPVGELTGAPVGPGLKKTQSPDAAARLALERGDERSKVASTTTDNAGNVHHWNKFGEEINAGMGIGKGKPSATFEKTQAQQKQMKLDLDTTISELEKATAKGGLIEKATGSGFGAGADWAAGLVGKATEGSIAIGALKPIYDKVLKMVPRFEGPQSDKDTASYNDAAGNLANPNTPRAVKLEAAKQILRLMKDRKNQFLTRDMAEGSAAAAEDGGWKDL